MISRIEALNYRSLRYVSQELRPFQILVGPNASGKSTFLDVPALLGDFVRYGVDAAILFGGNNGHGRARSLEELFFNGGGDSFEVAIELPIPGRFTGRVFVLESEGGRRVHDSTKFDLARYEVGFRKSGRGELEIADESLFLIVSSESPRHKFTQPTDLPTIAQTPKTILVNDPLPQSWYRVVSKEVDAGSDFYQDEAGTGHIVTRIGPRRSALSGLPEDPSRFPVAIWVRDMLLNGIRTLTLNSQAMRLPVSRSAARTFNPTGANLPIVIEDLKRDNRQSYDDWIAHLQTILPDLVAVEVVERPEDRSLYLAVRYRTNPEPVPSWLVSDGTLRLLALTLIAYLPDQSNIYLIEEPENGIHPKAIEGVFQSLSSVYDGQVLVATHSPLLLGLAEPEQLLCFDKDSSGAVSIISGDKHPALKNWHGQVDLATLYAAGVLG